MPEIVPKSIQTCFEHVLGQISRKLFDQCSMEARDFKFLKIVEKISKFQLCQKSLPKLSKCVLNMFWGNFFEKFLSPVLHGGSRLRKFSKKSKKFQNSKNAQKSFPKVFKRGLNKFWGKFFEKFLTSFPWSVESSKHFKKNQKIFKIPTKNAQNRSQKNPKVF